MKLQIIWWKASALMLSWALLCAALAEINTKVTHLDPATFGAIVIASAAYLIATIALLKPLGK